MSIPKAFNKIFISLIDDCILVFPEDNDLKNYKKGAKILDQFNPKKPSIIFKTYSEPYRTHIENRDEAFFLNNDYSTIDAVDDDVTNFINKIKILWNDLSDDNKEKIWKYLQTLCALTDRI